MIETMKGGQDALFKKDVLSWIDFLVGYLGDQGIIQINA